MKKSSLQYAISRPLSISLIIVAIYQLAYGGTWQNGLFPLALVPFSIACGFWGWLLHFRASSLRQLVLANLAMAFLTTTLLSVFDRNKGLSFWLLALIITSSISVFSLAMLTRKISYRSCLRFLDLVLACALAVCAYVWFYSYPITVAFPPLAACLVSFFSLALHRRDETGRRVNWLILVPLFVLLLAFASLVMGHAGSLGFLFEKLVALGKSMLDAIVSFFNWLAGLMPRFSPGTDDDIIDYMWNGIEQGRVVIGVFDARVALALVLALVAAVAAVICVLLLRHFTLTRGANHGVVVKSRQNHFFPVKVLAWFFARILDRIYLAKHRNTAIGLYFWIEAFLSHSSLRRKPDESAKKFLLRVGKLVDDESFVFIARDVDRAFYSGICDTPHLREAPMLRRKLRRHVAGSIFNSFRSRLASYPGSRQKRI